MHVEFYRRPDGFTFAVQVPDQIERAGDYAYDRDPISGAYTGELTIKPAYEPPPGSVPVTEAEWEAVEPHYFQAGKGRVLDMWKRLGGNPMLWIERGWTEIDRATFQVELARQQENERQARAEWIADMGEDGLRAQGENLDQFAYEMAARGTTRKG